MRVLMLESLPYESAFRVGSHHYARRMVEAGWDVMWVSYPISPLHFVHRIRRDFQVRLDGWRSGPVRVGGLRYYSPFTLLPSVNLPVLRSRFVARNSAAMTIPSLRRVLLREGFASPDLVWLTSPVYAPLVDSLTAGCVAMRIADDTAAFRGVSEAMGELEAEAQMRADLVFAVSGRVEHRLGEIRSDVHRLPNGVDLGHFSRGGDEPTDLADIPHPRAVYVGALEYWFDTELVAQAARARPDVSFVVIGPASGADLAPIQDCGNVFVLGARPYEELPAYLQHCDVGIVPFVRDELVDAIHPIKVYEYLAAGLPVAAVGWTELEEMHAPIETSDREGFVDSLERALSAGWAGRDERIAFAGLNSWDARFELVRGLVEARVARDAS